LFIVLASISGPLKPRILLPKVFAVFIVGHHVPDVNDLGRVRYECGHPEMIPADVKDHKILHEVGIWKKGFEGVKIIEFGSFYNVIPPIHTGAGFRMNANKIVQAFPGDESHGTPPRRACAFFRSTLKH
jgi:hypothetical protein